jgi:hypothetical protein
MVSSIFTIPTSMFLWMNILVNPYLKYCLDPPKLTSWALEMAGWGCGVLLSLLELSWTVRFWRQERLLDRKTYSSWKCRGVCTVACQ